MKSCFSDLPVKDGKSGTWKLDTFEITTDKALTLALRAGVLVIQMSLSRPVDIAACPTAGMW